MKRIFFCLFSLILSSCDSQLFSKIQVQTTMKECPQIPNETLIPENVKTISIDGQQVKESGIVQTGRAVGYSFIGKKNQQLRYQTTEGICMWIYSPDNEVITNTTLPQDGKYTVQITTLQGSKTFGIEIGLDVKAASASVPPPQPVPVQSTPIPSSYSFSPSDFPQVSCGDSRPNDPNAYPVRFYPVKIPYTEPNLSKARALFCTDALKRSNKKTNIAWIQVASFNDLQRARAFAKFVGTEINGAIVGEPNLLELK
jgi:hypothetical protein